MYPIVIPSRGRWNNCATVDSIPARFRKNIYLFVLEDEAARYQRNNETFWNGDVHICCASTSTDRISLKRRKMAEYVRDELDSGFFWMMDDDLKFFSRIPGTTRLAQLTENGFSEMFSDCESMVSFEPDRYCAIGISMRQGNNNLPDEGAWNTRLIRCGLYKTDAFLAVEHDRIQFMGDFDVMIQMLKLGYDNHVTALWAQDHGSTNAKGGCSLQRNEEVMNRVANELAEFHPGCVQTKEKINKTGKMAIRTDVTIYWKKARASAN